MKAFKFRNIKLMQLTTIAVTIFLSVSLQAQYMGSITCFNEAERAGGNKYPYNQSLFLSNTGEAEWWDNIAEELYHSGLDFSALLCRGYSPGRPSIDMGDPRKIPNLIEAMDRRGLTNDFKLAIFDDCPASWTANHNYDQGNGHNTDILFDCRDTNNYKYIWDYNLKISIENIPDERRFKIDGRMVISFWSVKPTWMTNIDFGSLKRIIAHIRTECQKEFGFNPYLVVSESWFQNDTHLRASDVDGVHNWFSSANKITWTLHSREDLPKMGVLNPGIRYEGQPGETFNDPNHGQTLINGLEGTVKSGALITLCEGFTNAAETAAFWRSKDTTYYDYPNQRLDILRRYTQKAFLGSRMVQVEACDFFHDVTPGNKGESFRAGDIDICKTNDVFGGWNVFDAEAQEWMEWKELPIPQNAQFELRYASNQSAQIQFILDDIEGEILSLEPTGGEQIWSLARDTSFIIPENTYHSVKIKVISGKLSMNYFNILGNNGVGRVALASPVEGARYLQTDSIQIKADAIGFTDKIQTMEVFIDNSVVFSTVSSTIDTYLTDLEIGDYLVKVRALDENGYSAADSCMVYVRQHAYTISDSIVGNGTITFDPPGGTYVEGSKVYAYANPNYPSYFSAWSGDTISTVNPLVLTMNKNIHLVATFIAPSTKAVKVNFQPEGSPVPQGYLKDYGIEYSQQDSGLYYGWVGGSNQHTRDRGKPDDIRYATLNHMQKSEFDTWEIEVDNGNYLVYLVMGDPSFTDQINTVNVEGVLKEDTDHSGYFDEFRLLVEVKDNKLTIAPGEGAENAKICFVEISIDSTVVDTTPVDTVGIVGPINVVQKKSDLKQNYPNPFSTETEIAFTLATGGKTQLMVYNLQGQYVTTLVNENMRAGQHQVKFNGADLPYGIYFYQLKGDDFSIVRKMVRMKP